MQNDTKKSGWEEIWHKAHTLHDSRKSPDDENAQAASAVTKALDPYWGDNAPSNYIVTPCVHGNPPWTNLWTDAYNLHNAPAADNDVRATTAVLIALNPFYVTYGWSCAADSLECLVSVAGDLFHEDQNDPLITACFKEVTEHTGKVIEGSPVRAVSEIFEDCPSLLEEKEHFRPLCSILLSAPQRLL